MYDDATADAAREAAMQAFDVVPFDARAAVLAGRLWNRAHPERRRAGAPKPCLKVDCEIIACAARWGADGLVVRDEPMLRLAALGRDLFPSLDVGTPPTFLRGVQRDFTEGVGEP